MEILYDNHVFDSTISASSENPFYTFDDALNDNALARVGRTAGDTSQWILFDATAAVSVDFFYIQSHNITSGATIKIQANASDSWGSPSIDQTVTWSSGYMLYEWGSTQSYRYWRFSVSDASNTDDYIELSYVFLGQALSMPGMELSQDFGRNTTSTATFSNS